jgi:hypothetical protein
MIELSWHPEAFAGPDQLRILIQLTRLPEIGEHFFLTGGTALAVFYLGHRTSEDLDLFAIESGGLSEILFQVARIWPKETSITRRGEGFASVLVRGVKIDFVCDPLSLPGSRRQAPLEEGALITVDSIENIASNKLTTLVARTEIKDYLDFYMISRTFPELDREVIFAGALSKERMFEDPASAAYQIESAVKSMKRLLGESGVVLPGLIKPVNGPEFRRFYGDVAGWLYEKGS